MTLELEHLDAVIDSITIPLANRQEAAETATGDLLWLGCHLLSLGEKALAANGLPRPDLAAAVATAETLVVGRSAGMTPSLSPVVNTQVEQLRTVRAAIVDKATERDHGTHRYAAVLVSLDSVFAALTGLQALLKLAPALLPTD
ncbi:hypothetical protein LWP59_02665 [Amycolatopsis acidiphila]|uniref:Uncharacterized protein n=1 Tax=Amycolatopsis acidiphila TaxID=715473 RepID=A0A558A3T8_9PSEU|nr:hypothetical protein [Amycolatopsis acidiphila]TVT18908.1 hypothetical protein FNH06_26105 [Amycolatopsis acidiphila]UIJ60606.1 hypothetical protein LWP59_02665 [Amycolatopsis acidiphila]GHG81825.1 hypothetical protein GCM10017788_51910 [Amycolatopsis acidiphila]